MQPVAPRDFLKVSLQRLTAAEKIMNSLRLTLEAQYIAGYAVECAFKALIIENTPQLDRSTMLAGLTRGAKNHRPEVLLGILKTQGIALSPELARRMRRFDWGTEMRYETGRKDTGETNGLLRTVRAIYHWAEEQIP
jgi:hypothetical protein